MRKNNKTNISEYITTSALVFDRIYGTKANAAQVIAQRILVSAAITFFCMSYVFSTYGLPVNKTALPFIAAGASVVFSLLFAAVKKRIAIPVIIIISGIVILSAFEAFWKKFSFFIDGVLLEVNGRLFTVYTIHPLKTIEVNGKFTAAYVDGVVFGSVILCVIFALITAAGVMGKPHILPSLSAFLLLWIPKLMSERLRFGWQLIPIVALYAGMLAIGSYYRDGLAIRHVYAAGGYRRKVAMDDRRFNTAVKAQSASQRMASRGLHYSKYFSSVMSAVAVFTVLGIILTAVFKKSDGINYDPFYEFLNGLGSGFGSSDATPFKSGAEADYFTSPSDSVFKANDRLRLTSPSTSTKEIIRVTKPVSKKPLYLRGDIGIDFDGTSWSSPVTDEPRAWKGNGVGNGWLPIELIALVRQLDESSDYLTYGIGMDMNVSVEYLCDTNVVFAPAYDHDLHLFEALYASSLGVNSSVRNYGDFASRRRTDKSAGETLGYTAAVPFYTDAADDFDISYFGAAYDFYIKNNIPTDDYAYINNMLTEANVELGWGYYLSNYGKYASFVKSHYLAVPDKMKDELDAFIESSGLNAEREKIKQKYNEQFVTGTISTTLETGEYLSDNYNGSYSELPDRFLSAFAVSEYLRSNYTYSLDARIDGRDPVMSFLTGTKSGHCALYASAMTLILREWGIPARYCTGFAAAADLSMTTLRSRDLHAWVEVYLDGLGWVTFDPTASAIFSGQGGAGTTSETSDSQSISISTPPNSSSSAQSDSSSAPESSGQSSSRSDNSANSDTHSGSEDSVPEDKITFAQVLPYLLIILAIFAGVALIVLAAIAYIKLRKRAYKQIQLFRREKNSEYVYEKLLAVLRFGKLTPSNGEQPHTFFERAEQTLECDICDSYGIFERLAFGQTELDESERAQLGQSFDKIYKAVESKFVFIGKIRLRLMILSKKV